MTFMGNVQQLSLSPTGEAPTLGRPRRAMSMEDMHRATETDALIGTLDETAGRLRRLQVPGVTMTYRTYRPRAYRLRGI
jgi:hypothetical protein